MFEEKAKTKEPLQMWMVMKKAISKFREMC